MNLLEVILKRIFLDYYLVIQDERGKEIKELCLDIEVLVSPQESSVQAIHIDGKPTTLNNEVFLKNLIGEDDIIDKAISRAQD